MIGRIKMYNEDRGFGFIFGEDEEDYFFHISDFKDTKIPRRDNVVSFVAGKNRRVKWQLRYIINLMTWRNMKRKLEKVHPNQRGYRL